MDWLVEHAYLAPAVPFALSAVLFLLGRFLGRASAWLAMLGPVWVLLTGAGALAAVWSAGHGGMLAPPWVGHRAASGSVTWMSLGGVDIGMGFSVDGLSAIMLAVVGLVSLMVMLFSVGYMAADEDYVRYFETLSLFTASMTGLVIADGLIGLFLAWELVGVCSYLLIGFWYEKPSASAAAIKAFMVTRVGDVGFLLGLAYLWSQAGALSLEGVMAWVPSAGGAAVVTAALLLFAGAAGKSAQFPLHIWLPDAMEGPTPVSALIHAATMVAAGVFLVGRTWPLFEAAEAARTVMLACAIVTALGAATVAVAQRDIKKVLAYSTISQLGFMFAALAVGAWRIAVFHLVTHAAFKALLFLASGSVIHGAETQDMREMGGLARKMPVTAATWVVGAAALAGIPPLAGFFSKDEVVHAVTASSPLVGVLLLLASLLTAFYITRATLLTFTGDYRGTHHPHESGPSMLVPLAVLAVASAVLGFFGHSIAEALGGEAEALDAVTAAVSVAVALTGVAAAWLLYRPQGAGDEAVELRLGRGWSVLAEAYGFDAAVTRGSVGILRGLAGVAYAVVDRLVFDGVAEGAAGLSRSFGRGVSRVQNGDVHWYGALAGAGVIVMIAVTILAGR